MPRLPDLTAHGYELLELLTTHPGGGRATYRARRVAAVTEHVVVKQFRFAEFDASWAGFTEQEREIEVLRELSHPRIPAYLDSFTTDDGFCLVQAFVDLPSIATRTSFDADEVKRIALSVLEILTYLQRRLPPVIHRDLKPANILISREGEAYLVDFGLARAGEGSASTVAIGTPGFMAPEQLLGRALTPQTDLFGLGATLVSMLTGVRSADLASLIDTSMRFDLGRLPAGLEPQFVQWLRTLVAPDPGDRFANAEQARRALEEIDILRPLEPTAAARASAPAVVPTASSPGASSTGASSTAVAPTVVSSTGASPPVASSTGASPPASPASPPTAASPPIAPPPAIPSGSPSSPPMPATRPPQPASFSSATKVLIGAIFILCVVAAVVAYVESQQDFTEKQNRTSSEQVPPSVETPKPLEPPPLPEPSEPEPSSCAELPVSEARSEWYVHEGPEASHRYEIAESRVAARREAVGVGTCKSA